MKINLLENETIERKLTPHPLSFVNLHLLWFIPLIWGFFLLWLFNSAYWDGIGIVVTTFIWMAGIALFGIIASLSFVRWRIFFSFVAIIILGLIISWDWKLWDNTHLFLPLYTIFIFILGLPLVEIYRRSHRYVITDLRILLRGGIVRVKERSLRYEKITDIDASQGIIGKIFGFGDIIPITPSGFGLGQDEVFAGGGVEAKKKVGIFGFAGGGKGINTPRTRSYYELHGVHPYRGIRELLENLVQRNSVAPYQREQLEIQKEILDSLRRKEE
ncbi:MAG: PH domain-containing protein [Candidatus Thermoplasmatota archaeon]|nr:PH domain-containing protein [Candidatus Thermoplasmatota archaeon]